MFFCEYLWLIKTKFIGLFPMNSYDVCIIVTDSYKNLPNFNVFKNRIKKWKPESCPCTLRKIYIPRVGFTQASSPVSWIKLWYFLHSCLYRRELVLKFFTFRFVMMFIAFSFFTSDSYLAYRYCNFIHSYF